MKYCYHLQVISFACMLLLFFSSCNRQPKYGRVYAQKNAEQENEMYDGAGAAQEFEIEKTKDPALGYVPKERLYAAMEFAEQSKLQEAFRTEGVWVERGSNSDAAGPYGNSRPPGAVTSGRMRAIWVDNADATGNTVWVGGIDGGLWKTTNFNTNPATWTPINDFFSNLAIASICQDPTDPNIMYFGTGEKTYNADAVNGGGVWKSTNHGVTWNLLSSTTGFSNCSKILCDAAGNIYCATVGPFSNTTGVAGLLRSTKASGGAVWTNIEPMIGANTNGAVPDFIISSTGRMHVYCGYYNSSFNAYRYTDNPSTVTQATWISPVTTFPSTQSCVLAAKDDTIYSLPSVTSPNWTVPKIYKSVDGGANWAATAASLPTSGDGAFTNGQTWYCLAADVDPTNANNIIVGSLNCFRSTDGGVTFTKISDWYGTAVQYVHADQQIIKYGTGSRVIVGCDGGIFFSSNGGSTFSDRNTNLRIKQFYSCAIDPVLPNYFLAGAQDNGVHQFNVPGLGASVEVEGGDGGTVHIDQGNRLIQVGSYVRSNYEVSLDGGANWFYYGLSNNGLFINPTDYDSSGSKHLYAGWSAGYYSRMDSFTYFPNYYYYYFLFISQLNNNTVFSVTVSPHLPNTIYLGTNNSGGGGSRVVKVINANNFPAAPNPSGVNLTTATLPPTGVVSCVAVGPKALDSQLVVTYSNYGTAHVFYSNNAGTSWTNISGNLPDMPVRWALINPSDSNQVLLATEAGVFTTSLINGGSTVWAASPGFPTVRTDMLKYRASDKLVAAATHGRGLWTQSILTILPVNNFTLRGNWKNNETVELNWDYNNINSVSTFDIESSKNGTDFIKAGTVSGNARSFLDQPSFSNIFYRIKSKNIQGRITYSNIIHLQKGISDKEIVNLKIFPNPVKDEIKIAFSASGNGKINYQVTGINGQTYWRKEENISSTGDYIRNWNMQNLQPGTYTFTILYNNKKISQKFTKQ